MRVEKSHIVPCSLESSWVPKNIGVRKLVAARGSGGKLSRTPEQETRASAYCTRARSLRPVWREAPRAVAHVCTSAVLQKCISIPSPLFQAVPVSHEAWPEEMGGQGDSGNGRSVWGSCGGRARVEPQSYGSSLGAPARRALSSLVVSLLIPSGDITFVNSALSESRGATYSTQHHVSALASHDAARVLERFSSHRHTGGLDTSARRRVVEFQRWEHASGNRRRLSRSLSRTFRKGGGGGASLRCVVARGLAHTLRSVKTESRSSTCLAHI